MQDPTPRVPQPRTAQDDAPVAAPRAAIPVSEPDWRRPGVHRVRLADREVWVRMDERGIVSMSSIGPDQLADCPLD